MARRITLYADERGATAIEYGLIAALIAVAGLTALQRTGERVDANMTDVSEALPAPATGGGSAPPGP